MVHSPLALQTMLSPSPIDYFFVYYYLLFHKQILFADKVNQHIFYTNNGAKTMHTTSVGFAADDISINRQNTNFVVASSSVVLNGKTKTRVRSLNFELY